jgi:hypothetical protein
MFIFVTGQELGVMRANEPHYELGSISGLK